MITTFLIYHCITVFIVVAGKKFPLNPFISHYEPVHAKHIEALNNHRRSIEIPLRLQLKVFRNEFDLHLQPVQYQFKMDNPMYEGHVIGEKESSNVFGYFSGGSFFGHIKLEKEMYHFESARRYFDYDRSFDAIVYRTSDIRFNLSTSNWCGNNHDTHDDHYHNPFAHVRDAFQKVQNVFSNSDVRERERRQQSIRGKISNLTHTCWVKIVGETSWYNLWGRNRATAQSELISIFNEVNKIYQDTNFFGSEGYKMIIGFDNPEIMVDNNDFVRDVDDAAEQVLQAFAQRSPDDWGRKYCLLHLVTNRDYASGILGRAYVGSPNLRGICAGNRVQGNLNTGIASVVNYGAAVPRIMTVATIAHEMGHGFGSNHDPDYIPECVGNGSKGNYLMYAQATDGLFENNNKFSQCSIQNITRIINQVSCFGESPQPRCGNGIKESSTAMVEQCDSGGLSTTCCTENCQLTSGSQCSPLNDACCEDTCKLKASGVQCNNPGDCIEAALCNGVSGNCPQGAYVSANTPCGHGSGNSAIGPYLCDAGGLCNKRKTRCDLKGLPNCMCANPDEECILCCEDSNGQCKPYHLFQTGDPIYHSNAQPCMNNTGYCSNKTCNVVKQEDFTVFDDAASFFAITKYFWVAGIGAFLLFLALYGSLRYFFPSPSRLRRQAIESQMRAAREARFNEGFVGPSETSTNNLLDHAEDKSKDSEL